MHSVDLQNGAAGVAEWGNLAKNASEMAVNAWQGIMNVPGKVHQIFFANGQSERSAPLTDEQERVAKIFDLEVTNRQTTSATEYEPPSTEKAMLPTSMQPLPKEVKDYVATHPARKSFARRAAAGTISVITFAPRMALEGVCVIARLISSVVKGVFSFITYPLRGAAEEVAMAKPEPTPEKKAEMRQYVLEQLGRLKA